MPGHRPSFLRLHDLNSASAQDLREQNLHQPTSKCCDGLRAIRLARHTSLRPMRLELRESIAGFSLSLPCEITLSCVTGHRPSSLSNLWAFPRLPLPAVGTIYVRGAIDLLQRCRPCCFAGSFFTATLTVAGRGRGVVLFGDHAQVVPCVFRVCCRKLADDIQHIVQGPARPVGQSDRQSALALPIALLSGLGLFTHAAFVCVAPSLSMGRRRRRVSQRANASCFRF
jgi:hypothetical protein